MPKFRRLLLPAERLPEELKRVQDGALVRLPLTEFDALVERASRAVTKKVPPRLLEARYHATLKEESLIGEGQWKLSHKGSLPCLLPLEPFNLAVKLARFENDDALIAAFDGKNPALLVETPGEHTVSLDWSARGESGPEGLQFHLEIPSCPVSLLELDVPVGRGIAVLDDDSLLSGPHEAEAANQRRWKIVCGGRQRAERHRLDFRIYAADRPSAADRLAPFVRQKTTQKLHPDGLDAAFELSVDNLTQNIRELVCECDAELRLRDVVGPGVAGYSFQAGTSNKPSRLTIRLREPVRSGTWQVLCLAPLTHFPPLAGPLPVAWKSPGLRLVHAVSRGESLTLWLHPDLRVQNWDSGSFRIESSTVDRATGSQILTLAGGGLSPSRRPAAFLQAYDVEFAVQQLTWWRCDAAGMSLTLQIGWDVRQGQLFQLPVLLPANWSVEKVEMTPAALLRDWHIRKGTGTETLVVDLRRPLSVRPTKEKERSAEALFLPAATPRPRLPMLTVHLRPSAPAPVLDKPMDFPDAVPRGARFRQAALALDCDEQLYHFEVRTAAERAEPESEGLWGQLLPEYYYRYRNESPQGTMWVRPRPPRLRARCESEVVVGVGEAMLETHLLLEADAGSPETIELALSASDGEPWHWGTEAPPRAEDATVNRIRQAERIAPNQPSQILHLLASSNPLQAAVVAAAQPRGERWRLTLTRPLRARELLRLRARRGLHAHGNRWDVPLPVVLGANRMEGEVRLHLANADLIQVRSAGLREIPSVARKGAVPWRTFRYGSGEVRLTLSGQPLASERLRRASIDRARLVSYVGENAVLRHHFSFQVANWSGHTLTLQLPPRSQPWAVQVDGRWLPRIIPSAAIQNTGTDAGNEGAQPIDLVLPVPSYGDADSTKRPHRFEVIYTRTFPAWKLWQALDGATPRLPIAPVAFRHIWRLHPRLSLLFPGRYQSLAGTDSAVELASLPHQALDFFHFPGSLARLDPLQADHQAAARAALASAALELGSRHVGQTLSLREIVSETAFGYLKGRYCLIIDALALREAAVAAETPLTIKQTTSGQELPPWSECGLRAVPARSVILLTTKSGRGAVFREPLAAEVENALDEAARYGQDSSGRFLSALYWLQPDGVAGAVGAPRPEPIEFAPENISWSEWESVAGGADEPLILLRRDVLATLGLGLGFLVGLLFWLLRRRFPRLLQTLVLLVLSLAGLGVVWLPAGLRDLAWWPLLAAGGAAVYGYLRVLLRRNKDVLPASRPSKNVVSTAAVAGVLLLTILGWPGRAAAPLPVAVYLVPGSGDGSKKPAVLVPLDLLQRLKVLAQPAPLVNGGPQAVLLDAAYEGQLIDDGKQAEFTAVFSAQSLREEPSALILPLAGVQLTGEVLLDGARIAPLALPAPQVGYSLSLRGRGRHKIELTFRTPVIGTEENRNVLFTAPSLVRNHLSWRVLPGAVQPQVLVKNGAQWMSHDGNGQRLEADLGAVPLPVQLHWYQPRYPPRISYQAAYLWELGVEGSHLTAWLRYHVAQGAVKTLTVDLPAELEISSASAQRRMPASGQSWRTRFQLRRWFVTRKSNKRTLHLELPYPISGDFQVTLELLPHAPMRSPASLPLPSPLGVAAGGSHYLAYRTHVGLTAQRETSQNLTRIDNKELARDWLGERRLDADFRGIAYRIATNQSPKLILRLDHTPPVVHSDLDVTVQVGAQRAELDIDAEVRSPDNDLAVLVWDLPPRCSLDEVTGADVRTWKQNGSRLLVWLNRTTARTRIHVTGWLTLQQRDGHPHLELIGPRLSNAEKQHTRLHLVASGEVALAQLRTRNLQAVSEPNRPGNPTRRASETDRTYETSDLSYQLECQIQSAANAEARVLTLAEVVERELRFTTTVDYTVSHGELRHVRLRLRNWEEEKVDLQADHVALWPGPRRAMGERSWLLPLQKGVRGHYRMTLRGTMPLDKATVGVSMPEVLVQDVKHADYLVALVGGELSGEPKGALQAARSPRQLLQADWPRAADRVEKSGGQAWSVGGAEWQLRLLPNARAQEPTAVHVYLLEQSAAVVDGKRWLHAARYWLRHEAHADLHVIFPLPARVVAASVDGIDVTPLQAGAARVWLPLPGQSGVRSVLLHWFYDPAEPRDRPNLASPQLADAVKGPILQTVRVPPGWQIAGEATTAGWGTGSTREAALALGRADAQLRILQDMLSRQGDSGVPMSLFAAQHGFEAYSRHAAHALDSGADQAAVPRPQGQSLSNWLDKLQADYRLLHLQVRPPQTDPASTSTDFALSFADHERAAGIPLSRQAQPGAEVLHLQFVSRESEQFRQALISSAQWLGCLLIVWIVALKPFLRTRLRLLWPEQIALLGLFGWYLAGLTAVVVGLLVLAVCSRMALLLRGLPNLISRWRQKSNVKPTGRGAAVDAAQGN